MPVPPLQFSTLLEERNKLPELSLLVSLLLSLVVLPLFEGLSSERPLWLVGLTLTIIAGILTTRFTARIVLLALAVVTLPAAWLTLAIESRWLFGFLSLCGSATFFVLGATLVASSLKRFEIHVNAILNGMSAYLLLGMAWALAYLALLTFNPQAIHFPATEVSSQGQRIASNAPFSEVVYFSFVTMTTLGYGDVHPISHLARTLCWLQAVVGQFYVAVVIAWLVSSMPRRRALDD